MRIKQAKSDLEKVPHACEGEVPQTHTVRGEKLMTDSDVAQGKGNQNFFGVCVCVFF